MLRVEGRAARGARGILSVLAAMAEDAITDEAASVNAFATVRIRANDPRIRKPPRKLRVWGFAQIREFARGGRPEVRAATPRPPDPRRKRRPVGERRFYSPQDYEALLLTPGFTGLRLGEFLALRKEDFDGRSFHCHASAWEGELLPSSEQKNHERPTPCRHLWRL